MLIISEARENVNNNEEDIAFQIILHAGNAKSLCMDAVKAASENKFDESDDFFKQAADELEQAHNCQTDIIRQDILDKEAKVSLLMVHAQDHVMNAITVYDLTLQIAKLYRR